MKVPQDRYIKKFENSLSRSIQQLEKYKKKINETQRPTSSISNMKSKAFKEYADQQEDLSRNLSSGQRIVAHHSHNSQMGGASKAMKVSVLHKQSSSLSSAKPKNRSNSRQGLGMDGYSYAS